MPSSTTSTPVRERYEELRADEAELEQILAGGADKARSIAVDTLARRARGDGSGTGPTPRLRSELHAEAPAVTLAYLEFEPRRVRGSVRPAADAVLREEVDLLEVDLADVVIAYIDHLERKGELDLEAATEFLVLIAALLELKSTAAAAGRGDRGDRA